MTLFTFVLRAQHPTNGTDLEVELVASTDSAAINRTRLTLMHRDRDAEWMRGTFTVTSAFPFDTEGRRK